MRPRMIMAHPSMTAIGLGMEPVVQAVGKKPWVLQTPEVSRLVAVRLVAKPQSARPVESLLNTKLRSSQAAKSLDKAWPKSSSPLEVLPRSKRDLSPRHRRRILSGRKVLLEAAVDGM